MEIQYIKNIKKKNIGDSWPLRCLPTLSILWKAPSETEFTYITEQRKIIIVCFDVLQIKHIVHSMSYVPGQKYNQGKFLNLWGFDHNIPVYFKVQWGPSRHPAGTNKIWTTERYSKILCDTSSCFLIKSGVI